MRRGVRKLAVRTAALGLFVFAAVTACSPRLRANLYSTMLQDDRPVAPFEIAPGLYYVGSSDIAIYALATSEGVIVIDGGYRADGRRAPERLRALGLDPADVKILLNTHAHVDHAAGLAALKEATGAELYASPQSAALLEAGGKGDFFLRDWMSYPPVTVDHVLSDGEVVRLGERAVTAHFTPGHAEGCTSWSFPIEVDGADVQALVICSLATLRYRLADNPRYPDISADYEHAFDVLRDLPCELFLADHGKFFDLRAKRQALIAGEEPNPFLDPDGCRAFIAESERDFRARLARQQQR